MTIPSGDDAPPEPSPAAPAPQGPRSPSADGSGAPSGPGGPWTPAEAVATPKPPQAWFAPPQVPAAPATADEPRLDGAPDTAGRLVRACLIGAAAITLVSAFLPWATWSVAVLRGTGYVGVPDQLSGRTVYGVDGNDGLVVVIAGLAALGLAIAAHAVSDRFAPYAAIPGGLALIAIFHDGITLGDDDVTVARTISWGYWIALVATLAVVTFGLAAAARPRPQS